MKTETSYDSDLDLQEEADRHRRSAWRQRLVDAEAGFRIGFRADSALITCIFCIAIALLTAVMAHLAMIEWAILLLCIGMTISAELLRQMINQIVARLLLRRQADVESILSLGVSAAFTMQAAAALVAILLFWNRFSSF